MDAEQEKIMNALEQYRTREHLTAKEIAQMLGVSQNTMTNWKKGLSAMSTQNRRAVGKLVVNFNENAAPSLPKVPDTIQNTPELLLCIKDAMMRQGLTSAADLNRYIGYDSAHSLERLLSGKLNWFPDVLSCVFDHLGINHDDAPITATERELLAPEGIFKEGGNLVRPVPVVDWANAASYIGGLVGGGGSLQKYWDPENTKTVPAPMGTRKGTMAFQIFGESMEPKLIDGDNVLCYPVTDIQDISNGKIVIAKFSESYQKCPDCVVCKRFRKNRDIICLTSDNSAGRNFDDIKPQDIAWIGVVTGKYNDDF